MKILVAVKRVPDTNTRLQLEEDATAISGRDVKFVMNPYDEIALEQAVRLKQENPDTEILAVCAGPEEAKTVLRTALAMGADRALHVSVDSPTGLELDGFQTAHVIVEAIRNHPFDLCLFGRLAVDDQSSQIGTMVARKLRVPSVADVTRVEAPVETRSGGQGARLHHLVEGGVEVVECPFPAVATAQKGLAEPHYPSVKDILTSKKKPIETVEATVPEAVLETVRLTPPPARQPGRIIGEGVDAVPELVRLLREEAKVI